MPVFFFLFLAVSAMPEKFIRRFWPDLFFPLFFFLQMTEVRKGGTLTQDGVDTHGQLGSEDQDGLFANAAKKERQKKMVQDEQAVICGSFLVAKIL